MTALPLFGATLCAAGEVTIAPVRQVCRARLAAVIAELIDILDASEDTEIDACAEDEYGKDDGSPGDAQDAEDEHDDDGEMAL